MRPESAASDAALSEFIHGMLQPRKPRPRTLLIGIGVALALAVAGGAMLVGGSRESEGAARAPAAAAAEKPAPVIVEPVRFASAAATVTAVGTGRAASAVALYPEAAGRVTEILFTPGQHVKRGQPLLRLDAEEEELNVQLARVRLEDARQQLERYERTVATGAVSATEVDRARTALSAARIELGRAELALRQRTLVAPFDGVIGIANVDVGDRVTESTLIATLDDRSSLLVDFEVPEAFAYGVRVGGEVTATTWALPGEQFVGTVAAIGSRIDPQTRTLRVRARFPNTGDRLRTGMSFTIRLPLAGDRFPSVPSVAVQWDRRGAYVWRVVDGKAERVPVRVLKREEEWVLVDAPLSADDRIVTEGVQRLRPGRAVEIRQRAAAVAAGELR